MLVRDGDSLYAYTTAPMGRMADVREYAGRRYSNYMMRRSIMGITPMRDGMRNGHTARVGNIILACGKSFAFVSRDRHVRRYPIRPNYAVVCRGFRGDVCALADTIGADTILLSRDLNLRRHDRYVRELTHASIPYRTLRGAPFHIIAN